jgi:late competence protein required for DNA uptake (superfamily II DNA/RNA helicase)
MSKRISSKLAPQCTRLTQKQSLETIEESRAQSEQKQEPIVTELDHEIECPRCNEVMELSSSFDILAYYCENCSFLLKCV